MKVSTCFYNEQGELMAPTPLAVKLASPTPGGVPSSEAGFYHRFKFEGLTEAERASKRRRFFETIGAIPRSMILAVREYEVRMDSYVRFGVDVLYAVETAEGAATPNTGRHAPSFEAVLAAAAAARG